jgi:DNA topoisomerase IB
MDPDIYKLYIQQVGYCIYRLHNSYSICRKSYIDPKIIEEILNSIKHIKDK